MSSSGTRRGRSQWLLAAICLLPLLGSGCTMAVHSAVSDRSGRPLQHAVVYATPNAERRVFPAGQPKAVMVVQNFEFQPPVLPVQAGTGVSFLNRDDIRHQIYSISAAKNFELFAERLSSSTEVVFDKPGVVVLGSAAHDRTIGHIYVLKTPYFATTGADGKAELAGLPRGAYEVRVWHPDMLAPVDATTRRLTDSSERRVGVDFTIAVRNGRPLAPIPPPAAVPRRGGAGH